MSEEQFTPEQVKFSGIKGTNVHFTQMSAWDVLNRLVELFGYDTITRACNVIWLEQNIGSSYEDALEAYHEALGKLEEEPIKPKHYCGRHRISDLQRQQDE